MGPAAVGLPGVVVRPAAVQLAAERLLVLLARSHQEWWVRGLQELRRGSRR